MRRSLAVVATVAMAAVAGTARAEDAASVAVSLEGCPSFDAKEIERLLALELSALRADHISHPSVRLVCEAPRVRIIASDTVTNKQLEREIVLSRYNERGRERVIALVISQLFLTSWMELLLPPPEPAVAETYVAPRQSEPELRTATQMAEHALRAKDWTWELDIGAAARVRGLTSPMVTIQPMLRPGLVHAARWHLFAEIGFELGSSSRESGSVGAELANAAIGGGWRSPRFGVFTLDALVEGGIALARVHGTPSPGHLGASSGGAAAQLVAAVGPRISLGSFHAGVELQAGWTAPAVTARVTAEDSVQLGGAWLGLAAAVGFGESRP